MRTYIRLVGFIRPHTGVFGLAALAMLGSTLLNGIQTGSLIPLADRIISNRAIPVQPWMPGWVAGVAEWFNGVPPMSLLTGFAIAIPILFFLKGICEFLQTFFMI